MADILGPETAFLDAAITRLKADSRVAALVGARVFDEIAANAYPAAPYIYSGPLGTARRDFGCGLGWEIRARFYVVSTDFGRLDAWAVLDAARAALDGALLTIPGFHPVEEIRVIAAGDIVSPEKPRSAYFDCLQTLIPKGA